MVCLPVTIIIVYVNDIVVTGKDMVEVEKLKKHLHSKFEIKDRAELRHLLKLKLQNKKWNCDMVSEIYNRSVGRNKNVWSKTSKYWHQCRKWKVILCQILSETSWKNDVLDYNSSKYFIDS